MNPFEKPNKLDNVTNLDIFMTIHIIIGSTKFVLQYSQLVILKLFSLIKHIILQIIFVF